MEILEKKYHAGTLSATQMLDQACHFFDGWTVTTLEDSWNEEYGQYIMEIDHPRTVEGLNLLNRGLDEIDIPEEQPPPPPPALAAAAAAAPPSRTFNACSVCYGEMNHDNWFILRPCWHCFCERCVKQEIRPERRPGEPLIDYLMRLRNCPTCRGDIVEAFKIFPNYVTVTEGDLVLPVVHADLEDAAEAAHAAAIAAAGVEVESEIAAEAAAARVLENQRIVAELMYSDR